MKTVSSNFTTSGHPRHPRPKFRRAFTLIEIMVVVAIIGLMAAMGLPAMFRTLQKEGMTKALSDVQDVCFSARQQAITSKQKTSVLFHPQEGRFSAEGAVQRNGKVASATLPNNIHFAMLDIFRQDYSGEKWARVFFYPDGTSDEVVIVLLGRGEQRKITLDYATGTPTVSDVDK